MVPGAGGSGPRESDFLETQSQACATASSGGSTPKIFPNTGHLRFEPHFELVPFTLLEFAELFGSQFVSYRREYRPIPNPMADRMTRMITTVSESRQ